MHAKYSSRQRREQKLAIQFFIAKSVENRTLDRSVRDGNEANENWAGLIDISRYVTSLSLYCVLP